MSWTTSSGATRYELDEQVNGGAFTMVQNTAATSWTASGKASGTYAYRVRACNSAGCSAYSPTGTVSVSVVTAPAGHPFLTNTAPLFDGQFNLNWTTVAGATRYEIEERPMWNPTWTLILNDPGTTMYLARSPGDWLFRARACNSAGCGPYSGELPVTIQGTPGVVESVGGSEATNEGEGP